MILNHNHFQGGSHLLPFMYSKIRYDFYLDKYSDVKLSYLDWYNSTFLIRGKSKTKVLDLASHILDVWKEYTDEEVDIRAYTEGVRHNTITPIVRKVDGEYYVYLILRNNSLIIYQFSIIVNIKNDKSNPHFLIFVVLFVENQLLKEELA